jgi:hypothetical protein
MIMCRFLKITSLIATLFLVACKPKVETVTEEIPVLRASLIYNADSVTSYLKKYKDNHKEMADSYFRQGMETEKSNPRKSVFFIKRAITLYPCETYYKELANLGYKDGDFKEMFSAYNLMSTEMMDTTKGALFHFDKKIEPEIIYNRLIANILDSKGILVDYADEDVDFDAQEMGIKLKELGKKVLADKRLNLDTASEIYKNLLLNFLTAKEITAYLDKPSSLNYFFSTIKDTAHVFEIDKKGVQQFDYYNFNGRNYRHMAGPEDMLISEFFDHYLLEKKQDSNWHGAYNFNRVVKLNDSITVVIYAIDTSAPACPIDMRELYHRLVTYNKKGQIIASAIVAKQLGNELATLRFDHSKYRVTNYKRYWEKPYDGGDFDNYLTKTEETGSSNYEIHPNGTISSAQE